MILPVTLYGDPILKKRAEELTENHPNLQEIIKNMWQTMYAASGIGLAAPQVALSIRLFIVDTVQLEEKRKTNFKGIKKVFINPTILTETGEEWKYEEGCLSIPGLYGDVPRAEFVAVKALDRKGRPVEYEMEGMAARVVQHEVDHLDGILFLDKVDPATLHWMHPYADDPRVE